MPPLPHPPYYNQQTIASKRKTGFHVSHTEGMSRLDHELEQFSDRLAPTDVEHNAKGVAMNEIERVLGTAYPGASVMAYGSYGERLYLPQNTLNLHALLPDTDFNDGIAWAVVELLRDEYRLATHAEVVGEFAVQLTIANANINIILTIGIEPPNSESFIWESDLVQFIHEFPFIAPIFLLIKQILYQDHLHTAIPSPVLFLVLVAYFQQHKRNNTLGSQGLGSHFIASCAWFAIDFESATHRICIEGDGEISPKGPRHLGFNTALAIEHRSGSSPRRNISAKVTLRNWNRICQLLGGIHHKLVHSLNELSELAASPPEPSVAPADLSASFLDGIVHIDAIDQAFRENLAYTFGQNLIGMPSIKTTDENNHPDNSMLFANPMNMISPTPSAFSSRSSSPVVASRTSSAPPSHSSSPSHATSSYNASSSSASSSSASSSSASSSSASSASSASFASASSSLLSPTSSSPKPLDNMTHDPSSLVSQPSPLYLSPPDPLSGDTEDSSLFSDNDFMTSEDLKYVPDDEDDNELEEVWEVHGMCVRDSGSLMDEVLE